MITPWLTDAEIDDLAAGVSTNGARVRHLRAMGLTVTTKPNGRPIVMRAHAEAVLSGLAQIEQRAGNVDQVRAPNRVALVAMFGHRAAPRGQTT